MPIEDPALERLYNWVRENGGIINVESRADSVTGVRGLYTTQEVTDHNEPILQIPSKLIVSPYHISRRKVACEEESLTYGQLFEDCPQLFHP